jgi:hypothetical protein
MNIDLNNVVPHLNSGNMLNHEKVADMVTLIQTSFKPRQMMKRSNFFESHENINYVEYVALDPKYNKL